MDITGGAAPGAGDIGQLPAAFPEGSVHSLPLLPAVCLQLSQMCHVVSGLADCSS